MDTPAVIAAVKACTEAQLREIEQATGVPVPTLAKIRYGVTDDPRSSTVDKLRAYFARTDTDDHPRRRATDPAPAIAADAEVRP